MGKYQWSWLGEEVARRLPCRLLNSVELGGGPASEHVAARGWRRALDVARVRDSRRTRLRPRARSEDWVVVEEQQAPQVFERVRN